MHGRRWEDVDREWLEQLRMRVRVIGECWGGMTMGCGWGYATREWLRSCFLPGEWCGVVKLDRWCENEPGYKISAVDCGGYVGEKGS